VLAGAWREELARDPNLSPAAVAVLASYLRDGQPLARQGGIYAALNTLAPNLARWLGDRLAAELGRPFALTLLHDGTAAARACAGTPQTAVITLGTSLGVGFAPPGGDERPLAPGFTVAPAG
jgi:hypothetical protein